MMLKKFLDKIERNRNSKDTFWRMSILIKDFLWIQAYTIYLKKRIDLVKNNPDQVFAEIYKRGEWGKRGDYFSGEGSLPKENHEYRKFVENFIKEKEIRTIVDLGCGDFRVSRGIKFREAKYLGIDVVGGLIKRNEILYAEDNIHFIKRDILKDKLPRADLCLLREVLQHLTNQDIKKMIKKMRIYRYVLITDCQKIGNDPINIDIERGRYRHGGLFLEKPPFNVKASIVLEYKKTHKRDILRTYLINNSAKE